MELIERLLFGSESLWGGGVAHSVLILALVVALGVMLGKLKVAGVSLGVTGILFVGIGFSYFGMNVDEHLMHFLKEFGLILFVYLNSAVFFLVRKFYMLRCLFGTLYVD
ncbi:aspartate-alanine antiporter-like transporter, partial [Alistipes shahii]